MAELSDSLDLTQACSIAAYDLLQDRYPGLPGDQLRFEVRKLATKLVEVCVRSATPHRAGALLPVVLRRHSLPTKKATTDEMAQWISSIEFEVGVILRSAGELVQQGAVAS